MIDSEEIIAMRARQRAHILADLGPGRISMSECELCNWTEWQSTDRGQVDEVVFSKHARTDCARCNEIYRRHPEVMHWIGGVAAAVYLHVAESRKP